MSFWFFKLFRKKRKIWQISALESKKWSNQQVKALSYNNMIYIDYLMYLSAFLLWPDHFLNSGAEICQIFHWFFGKFKKNQKDILKLTDL